MPRKKRNEILVGGFVAGATVLFFLLLFLMGSLDSLLASSTTVDADFGNVQGLQVGDPVWLFGNKVGKVAAITLLPREPGKRAQVRVSLRIPRAAFEYLRKDSIVKIDKQLTGNISVIIQESDGEPLLEGSRLAGTATADFATVTQKASGLLEEAQKVVRTVSRLVGEIESKGEIEKSLTEARALLENLNTRFVPLGEKLSRALEQLQGILDENRIDIRHTVANLRETSGAAKGLLEKLVSTPEQIGRSLGELEKAGAAIGGLVKENRSSFDTIVGDLRQVMTNASNLTSEVKRRPWRLLYRPNEAELKSMDLYDAAWAYNLGATELNRSIRDFTSKLEADPAGAKQPELLEEARRQMAQSLRRHREAEEQFWTRLKASQ